MNSIVKINDPVQGTVIDAKSAHVVGDGEPLTVSVEPGQGQPLNLDENWSISDRAKRPVLVKEFNWNSGQNKNTNIFSFTAMQLIREMSNLMSMITQFKFVRWKNVKLEFLMNTNQYHTGALAFINHYYNTPDANRWQSQEHQIFVAAQGNAVSMTLPWCSQFDWTEWTIDNSAIASVRVVEGLRVVNQVTPAIDVKVFAHVEGLEVMFTVPSFNLQSKQENDNIVYYPTTAKLFRPDGTATVMGNIGTTISDEPELHGEATIAEFLSHPYVQNDLALDVVDRTPYSLTWHNIQQIQNAGNHTLSNYGLVSSCATFVNGSVKFKLIAVKDAFTHCKLAIFLTDISHGNPATDVYKEFPYLIWDLKESNEFEFIAPIAYTKYRMVPAMKFKVNPALTTYSNMAPTRVWIQAVNNLTSTNASQTSLPIISIVTPQWTAPGTPGGLQFFQIQMPNWNVPIQSNVELQDGTINGTPVLGNISAPIRGNFSDLEELTMMGELTQRAVAIKATLKYDFLQQGFFAGPWSIAQTFGVVLPYMGPYPFGKFFSDCYLGFKASCTMLLKTDQDVDSFMIVPRPGGVDETLPNLMCGAMNPLINISSQGYTTLEIPGMCPYRFWAPELGGELAGTDSAYVVKILSHEFGKPHLPDADITVQAYHQTNLDFRTYFWNGMSETIAAEMNQYLQNMANENPVSLMPSIALPPLRRQTYQDELDQRKEKALNAMRNLSISRASNFDSMVNRLIQQDEVSTSSLQSKDRPFHDPWFEPRRAPAMSPNENSSDEQQQGPSGLQQDDGDVPAGKKKKKKKAEQDGWFSSLTEPAALREARETLCEFRDLIPEMHEAINDARDMLCATTGTVRKYRTIPSKIEESVDKINDILDNPLGFITRHLGESTFSQKLSLILLEILDLFTSKITKVKIAISGLRLASILGWSVKDIYEYIIRLVSFRAPEQENEGPVLQARSNDSRVSHGIAVATMMADTAMSGRQPNRERTQGIWAYCAEKGRDLNNMKNGAHVLFGLGPQVEKFIKGLLFKFFGWDVDGKRSFPEDCMKLARELLALHNPKIWNKIAVTPALRTRAKEAIEDFESLQERVLCMDDRDIIMKYNQTIPRMARDLIMYMRKIDDDVETKFTPFSIRIVGEPQIGKSMLIDLLGEIMAKSQDLDTSKYFVSDTNFHDGYFGQEGIIRDDRDIAGDYETSGEMINWVSPVPVVLNMADLTDKGRRFTSKYIISTGNDMYPDLSNISAKGLKPWLKRSHMLIKAKKRPGTNFGERMEHLEFELHPNDHAAASEQEITKLANIHELFFHVVKQFSAHAKVQFIIANLNHLSWRPKDYTLVQDDDIRTWIRRKFDDYITRRGSGAAFEAPTLQADNEEIDDPLRLLSAPMNQLNEEQRRNMGIPLAIEDILTDDDSGDETVEMSEEADWYTRILRTAFIVRMEVEGRTKYAIMMKFGTTPYVLAQGFNRQDVRSRFRVIVNGQLSINDLNALRRMPDELNGDHIMFPLTNDQMARIDALVARFVEVRNNITNTPNNRPAIRQTVRNFWTKIKNGCVYFIGGLFATIGYFPISELPDSVTDVSYMLRETYVEQMLETHERYLAHLRETARDTPILTSMIRNEFMTPPIITEFLSALVLPAWHHYFAVVEQMEIYWGKMKRIWSVLSWKAIAAFVGIFLFFVWYFKRERKNHKAGKYEFNTDAETLITESKENMVFIQDKHHNNLPDEGAHSHLHICDKCGSIYEHKHSKQNLHDVLHCQYCRFKLFRAIRKANPDACVVVDLDAEEIEQISTEENYSYSVPKGRKPVKVRVEAGQDFKHALYHPRQIITEDIPEEQLPKSELPEWVPDKHTNDPNIKKESKDKEMWRLSALAGAVRTEGDNDPNSHYLRLKIFKNMGTIASVYKGLRRTVNYVGICGNWLLTVFHPFAEAYKDQSSKYITIELTYGHTQTKRTLQIKKSDMVIGPEFESHHFKRIIRKDMLFLNLRDQGINPFRDITKAFAKKDDYPRVLDQKKAHLCVIDPEFPQYATSAYVNTLEPIGNVTPLSSQVGTQWGFSYDAPTREGWCGSVLVVHDPKAARKIIGIHFSGHRNNKGYALPITAEDIGDLMNTKAFKNYPVLSNMDDDEVRTQCCTEMIHQPIPVTGINDYIGVLRQEKVPYSMRKTDLRPSPIYQLVEKTTTEPAVLSHRDARNKEQVDPLYKELNKAAEAMPIPDRKLRKLARKQLLFKWARVLRKDEWNNSVYRILTLDEAINGDGAEVEPLNMKTSAGWPFVLQSKGGKNACFTKVGEFEDGRNKYEPTPEFMTLYIKTLDALRRGQVKWNWYVDSLKDERRTHVKVNDVKTRIFNIANAVWLVISKQYTWWFYAFLIKHKERTNTALGADMFGPDASNLVNFLLSTGAKWMDTDVPGWDGKFSHYLFQDVAWVIMKLGILAIQPLRKSYVNGHHLTPDDRVAGYSMELKKQIYWVQEYPGVTYAPTQLNRSDAFMIYKVTMSITCRVHIADDVVYRPEGGMPSGTFLTGGGNCTGNLLLDNIVFYAIYLPKAHTLEWNVSRDIDCGYVEGYMNNDVMGDDKLTAFSDVALTFISADEVADAWINILGYNVTNGDKTGPPDFRDLTTVTFLKCKFKEADEYGRYRMLMDYNNVIGELTNWIRSGQCEKEAIQQNVDDALRFAYQHGEQVYKDFQKRVNHALEARDLPPSVLSYEHFDRIWHSEYDGALITPVSLECVLNKSLHISDTFRNNMVSWCNYREIVPK